MAIRVVALNAALRNSDRSSMGLGLRRSSRTKATAPTAASARAAITRPSVNDAAPPSMTP
ncbi:hypothetical protein SALBM311S_00110 [Streptomyces alboniger]